MHCALVAEAQVTFRITNLPSSTPVNASIYISGNFEGWTGGQESYRLQKDADSLYVITLPQMVGTIQFKFTRGSWPSVEKGSNGEEIANRTYTFGGNGAIVNITVHNWADLSGGNSTAADNVHLLDDDFYMPQLDRNRRIWVYLPPDYETSQESYPVLYMHDGQNLFDSFTSFAGEWEVDETLNGLFDETGFGLIVVGIENGGGLRIDEYSPWFNPQYGGGDGEAYNDFISETLKPFVDSAYRTSIDASHTGLMGSSMGGLISHYGGIAEPDVFGRIGVFSPSFGLFDSVYAYTSDAGVSEDSKFYFLGGGQESGVVARINQMVELMEDAGTAPDQMHVLVDPQGMHNEAFWRGEFKDAVVWLFDVVSGVEDEREGGVLDIEVYPNPVSHLLHIVPEDFHTEFTLEMFDTNGKLMIRENFQGALRIDITKLSRGMYVLKILSESSSRVDRVMVGN